MKGTKKMMYSQGKDLEMREAIKDNGIVFATG